MDIATLLLEYLKELNAKSQKSQRKYLLNKGKKRFINNQKEEQYTEYSVIENHLRRISKSGKDRIFPIDNQTLEEFNIKTGNNVETVELHYGPYSDELTRAYHANALTIGATIYFNTKAYKPETEEGRKTLAHELTHVQQNKQDILEGQKTKVDLEQEAEMAEQIEKYAPEKYREIEFRGKKYKITKKEYDEIMEEIKRGVEEKLENNSMLLPEEDYLRALIKYKEFENRNKLIWQK